MLILGISAYYHDAAAVLIRDGKILAAAQEERFSRIKNDPSFPQKAVEFCLKQAGVTYSEIDTVVFYDKPFITFERLVETYMAFAPKGFKSFRKAMPVWITEKLFLKSVLRKDFKKVCGQEFKAKIYFSDHHMSHAGSAFFPSPYQEAAILTVDGVGEWATATIGHGRNNSIELLKQMNFPHSWGLFYSAITYFCGFKVNSGEYKLMGLAPYGQPDSLQTKNFQNMMEAEILTIHEDGSLTLNMKYFTFATDDRMIHIPQWEKLFNLEARKDEAELTQSQANFALAAQRTLQKGLLLLAKAAKELTGCDHLVMAGGVALNCVANSLILAEDIFKSIWIQPAAHDSGGALGAALAFHHIARGAERNAEATDSMQGSYLGPEFTDAEIKKVLREQEVPFQTFSDFASLCAHVAANIEEDLVIGWFQGRMEWGPRALGNRSIIASAKSSEMQKRLNLKIKFRESFRPFAPIVRVENANRFFKMKQPSPYMLLTAQLQDSELKELPSNFQNLSVGEKRDLQKSSYSAITHVDGSARVQTVDQKTNQKLWTLLKAYEEKTGHAVLVNTSFNVRGEPIVCKPLDAFVCFIKTDMDVLVLGHCVVQKSDLKPNQLTELRKKFESVRYETSD